MGKRLRQIRQARGKSQEVIAGLAGISASHLSRLESGGRALDRRSLIANLATALEVAPSEITGGTTVATPDEADEDRALNNMRLALLAVTMGEPRGEPGTSAALTARVTDVLEAQRHCRYAQVGQALPVLIRDLHATVNEHREEREVLPLIVLTHVQGTQAWLMDIGGPIDLAWQAATLARHAAERLDDDMAHAVSAFGVAFGLLSAGAFDLAASTVSRVSAGTDTNDAMQVTGMLSLTSSLIAAAASDHAERTAALEHAAELAERTGDEGNALGFGFGPSNVGVWRMSVALEAGEHADAARIATTVNPKALPSPTRQSAYWREYGRALARMPRRHADAVRMLRRAEKISPARIHRHPFMRSILAELLTRAKDDAIGRELRGMAYRAGLPV